MKRQGFFFNFMFSACLLLASCHTAGGGETEASSTTLPPSSESAEESRPLTGPVIKEGFSYTGRDLLMVDGQLYWRAGEAVFRKDSFEPAGTVASNSDGTPEEDFVSSRDLPPGTELYRDTAESEDIVYAKLTFNTLTKFHPYVPASP